MSEQHSPLPWTVGGADEPSDGAHTHGIRDAEDWVIADLCDNAGDVDCTDRSLANGEFIVRACNSHTELLDALKGVTEWLASQRDFELGNAYPEEYAAVETAKAAIAKAEGR